AVVVNARDVTERKRVEARAAGLKGVLERLAGGASLDEVLTGLVDVLDVDLGSAGAVLVREDGSAKLRLVAAPRLPEALRALLDGAEVAPGNELTPRENDAIRQAEKGRATSTIDPLSDSGPWSAAGLRSCWASPIQSAAGEVLGVLALYRTD